MILLITDIYFSMDHQYYNYHERRWFKNLNASVFMWSRWVLIISQIGFSSIIVITETTNIAVVGYCLAVMPSLIFIGIEGIIPWFDTDYKEGLHAYPWVISRFMVLIISLALLYLWLELHISWFLACVWVMIEILIASENMVTCDACDKLCKCCQSEYQTL